jgi:hypothetical protein
MIEPSLLQPLEQLVTILGQLLVQLLSLGTHWLLLILWVAWWLLATNWNKAWPALRAGGWAPLILLMLVAALAWSRLQPVACDCLGSLVIPNFWWQLGYLAMLVAVALFCGWLQGILRWAPPEVSLDAPAHGHGNAGHAAHH